MDILVLDAPMKFIHGKMVEQGAQEWSRYLTSQFNPIGRGTLYNEVYDKEGLKVYLYSASITLECVGESKGYLKVVKAEETDVTIYHKVIEEGKLLEEKITFVPVYKFQYINTKEHHDVERFLQAEKNKRALEKYIEEWHAFIENKEEHEVKEINEDKAVSEAYMRKVLEALYLGKTANPAMREFMPKVEALKKPIQDEVLSEADEETSGILNRVEKQIVSKAMSASDLYFVQNKTLDRKESEILKALLEQITDGEEKILLVAPEDNEVDELLMNLDENGLLGVHIQKDALGTYSFNNKVQTIKTEILTRLDEEASKHNRHKEELNQMKAECELYRKIDGNIQVCFDILETLKEIEEEKEAISRESEELGSESAQYVEALEAYENISLQKREVYHKIGKAVDKDETLFDEIVWMRLHEKAIAYEENKEVILKYSQVVHDFEKKLTAYKKQVTNKNAYEAECKELEMKLLELRRQYLKAEALNQVAPTSQIQTDDEVTEKIKEMENELEDLRSRKSEFEVTISTRHLDELSAGAYLLKEKVEAYIKEYRSALIDIYEKEEITKAEVIDVFRRMKKVEELFEEGTLYEEYLDGIEEYLNLEVKVKQNEALIKRQEANQSKMSNVLKEQSEVTSLLSAKLEEKEFKDFLRLIEVSEDEIDGVAQAPLEAKSVEFLEKIEAAVQQREFKLQVYKDKVSFYEGLSKLKEDWKQAITGDIGIIEDYLLSRIKVVGATCKEIEESEHNRLFNEDFEYVIIVNAEQIEKLELLVPMIHGKKTILFGNTQSQEASLFSRLFESSPKENKSILDELA